MAIINPAELDLKEEVVVKINRTAKVTSRGKRFRFSALIVVGDGNGHIGVGLGKANEVISAIQKGKEIAKRSIVKVSVINGTIPHTIIGKHGASKILLKPASPGTGIFFDSMFLVSTNSPSTNCKLLNSDISLGFLNLFARLCNAPIIPKLGIASLISPKFSLSE